MGLSAIFGGIGLVSSLAGDLQAQADKRRAQAALDKAISDAQEKMDYNLENMRRGYQRDLYSATGYGGDAIRRLGSNVGAANAGAGVWNSSATAGAITQAQANTDAAIRDLAAKQENSLVGQESDNQRYLTSLKTGQAYSNLNNARSDLFNTRAGIMGFLGKMGSFFPQGDGGGGEGPPQTNYGTPGPAPQDWGPGMTPGTNLIPNVGTMPTFGQMPSTLGQSANSSVIGADGRSIGTPANGMQNYALPKIKKPGSGASLFPAPTFG